VSTGLGERRTAVPPLAVAADGHPAWRHAIELGPVFTGIVFTAGAVAHLLKVPVTVVITVAAALLLVALIVSLWMARSTAMMLWGIATGMCAAGWAAYAAIVTPWTWLAFCVLVVPALLLITAWPAIRAHEAREADAERRRLAALAAAEERKRWPLLLAKIGFKGIVFVTSEDTRNGYKVKLHLPDNGKVTVDTLQQNVRKLEVAARVQVGTLRFEQLRDDQAHEVVLHVTTIDVLADTIPFPIPAQARSVNDPIAVGVYEDGSVCYLTLREVAVLIVGLRGSGKSNLINVLIASLAFCVDAVVFVIDQKSGRMAKPWVQPWIDAQTKGHALTKYNLPRPVVGWVATDADETKRLINACQRGSAIRDKHSVGGEKTTPSIDNPAFLVFCDEAAIAMGQNMGATAAGEPSNFHIAQEMKRMTILSRASAFDPLLAVQRGTVTMAGDGDLKSQCDLRVGLGVATEADARLIIPDDVPVAGVLAKLKHPGTGIVWDKKSNRIAPVKFYRITEDQIREVAIASSKLRPAPDALVHGAFGEDYDQRWHRSPIFDLPLDMPDPDDIEDVMAGLDAEWETLASDPDAALPPARRRMRKYMRNQAARGKLVNVAAIVMLLESEGMPVTRQTVHRWLNEDEKARLVESRDGKWAWTGG
jgi:FtsK/SpoIIIE family